MEMGYLFGVKTKSRLSSKFLVIMLNYGKHFVGFVVVKHGELPETLGIAEELFNFCYL